mmetsp:Transcript_10808/g.20094  ORF Transcript_10808/g.20094 Transcript_10808/m.20094 type:complete len:302 (-) Transcript_10808:121-1026(-)
MGSNKKRERESAEYVAADVHEQASKRACLYGTADAESLPSETDSSGSDIETALFEITGLNGNALASMTFDIRRQAADLEAELASVINVSVNHFRLSVDAAVLEAELPLKDQGIKPSSIVQVTVLRVQPFFGKWETASMKVSKGRNAGMRMQRTGAVPYRSNAIGAEGFTHGVHTARFRKIRGDGDYNHIGVCCGDLGLGISLATSEEGGGGGGAWVLWDGGELRQRIGNFHWTTVAGGRDMPQMRAVGSVVDISLDCERKVLKFAWPSGREGEIPDLPSVPLHFVLNIPNIGDAWEVEMLK